MKRILQMRNITTTFLLFVFESDITVNMASCMGYLMGKAGMPIMENS